MSFTKPPGTGSFTAAEDGGSAVDSAQGDEFVPPPNRFTMYLLILGMVSCLQMGLSIVSPFFPKEADAKGVSEGVVGLIFSIFQVTVILGSPVAMKMKAQYGAKSVLVATNIIGGLGNILLGLTWYLPDGTPFVIACMALRMFEGVAFVFCSTVGFGLIPELYGPAFSRAAGGFEAANGVALMSGPIVGSLLFEAGGGTERFGCVLPFLVLGCIEFSFGVADLVLFPPGLKASATGKKPSLGAFNWKVFFPCAECIVAGITLSLILPTLEVHLHEVSPTTSGLQLSIPQVGLAFGVECIFYTVLSPVAGWIDDWAKDRWGLSLMAFGSFLSGLGYVLLAPLDVGGLTPSVASSFAGTGLVGAGLAFSFVPVFKKVVQYATHADIGDRQLASAAVFTSALALGSLFGPGLGGYIVQAVGTTKAYRICAWFLLIWSPILFILGLLPAFGGTASVPLGAARESMATLGDATVPRAALQQGDEQPSTRPLVRSQSDEIRSF